VNDAVAKSKERPSVDKSIGVNYPKILLGVFAGVIFTFLVVPSVITVPMSFSNTRFLVFPPKGFTLTWYSQFLIDEEWVGPTLFSLKLAICTTLVSLILGFMASLALVRGSLPGRKFLNILFISPIMIPVIIIAFAVYGIYAKLNLIGSTVGLVLAHAIYTTPFVILVISANLYRFDITLEMAARNLGASAFKTYLFITLPVIKTGIITAGIFCFIMSFDELVLAMFLIGTKRLTLPIKMFSQLQFRIDPVVAAASTVFIMAAFAIILGLGFLRRERKAIVSKEKGNDSFEQ
jgi:ABC-type spermidine/putrescine transport system permease subunit II